MPSYTRGKKKENMAFVPANSVILYGFKVKDFASVSGISSSDLTTQLGHLTAAAAAVLSGKIMVVGANSPKPPRVSKKIPNAAAGTQRSVSTFCSVTTLSAALGAGWTLAKQKRSTLLRAASAGRNSLTAIATLSNGALYAFPLNTADFNTYGAKLGLESAATITTETEKAKLISGSRLPRPGRATLELEDGSDFTSFFSTGTDIGSQGFSQIDEEIVLTQSAPSNP